MSIQLLTDIKKKNWWQGSLIPGSALKSDIPKDHANTSWWIIASQTCNLYNPDFQKVPVFEIIAASEIDQCSPDKIRGDNPRILHVEAQSNTKVISLELDIQKRVWLPREKLSQSPAPAYRISDIKKDQDEQWKKKQWLDNFIGWLARSYNRIALPDTFNDALRKSRVKEILEKKLTKHADNLQGIYLLIESDSDNQWTGNLGEMPPPFILYIVLVVFEHIDPEPINQQLLTQLFEDKIKNPNGNPEKITRAELAKKNGIRIILEDVEVRSEADISLLELKSLVRYSLVDHLSGSSITPI